MSGLWGAVPQVRWSGERVDPPIQPEPAEPSVSANVAATLKKPQDEPSGNTAEAGSTISAVDSSQVQPAEASAVRPAGASRQPLVNSRNHENGSYSSTEDSPSVQGHVVQAADVPRISTQDARQVSGNSQVAISDPAQDQIERLKAALDDDAQRAKESPRQAGGSPDVRVRVESMLDSARRLFDLGQLREAHHTAKSAHDLGDSARLDYPPDEERPIDLVQRIDDRIKETAEQDELTTAGAKVPALEPAAENSNSMTAADSLTKPTPAATSDAIGPPDDTAPRPRRDWSYGLNVFRRDRKPATADSQSNTLAATSNPEPSVPTRNASIEAKSSVVQLDLEVDSKTSGNDAAVVRANRSLTLITGQQVAEVGAERLPRNDSAPIAYVPTLPRSDLDEFVEPSLASAPDRGSATARNLSELNSSIWPPEAIEPTPRRIVDEPAPPPDFEEVTPLSPFRDVASPSMADMPERDQVAHARPANQNWQMGCCVFGICALVAFFWYRRGAT